MKELLEQVMPEFEPVPDRVEKVRRRVRARRDRRLVVGAAAAVLAVAASAGVMAARPSAEMAPLAAAPDVCRAGASPVYTPLGAGIRLSLPAPVPEGASKVTLCVYEDLRKILTPRTEVKLIGFKEQAGDGSVERKINALPSLPMDCALSGIYRLVLEYPDRSPIQLQLSNRCGVPVVPEDLLRGGILDALDQLDGPLVIAAV